MIAHRHLEMRQIDLTRESFCCGDSDVIVFHVDSFNIREA
jgi:hypothetical protein